MQFDGRLRTSIVFDVKYSTYNKTYSNQTSPIRNTNKCKRHTRVPDKLHESLGPRIEITDEIIQILKQTERRRKTKLNLKTKNRDLKKHIVNTRSFIVCIKRLTTIVPQPRATATTESNSIA